MEKEAFDDVQHLEVVLVDSHLKIQARELTQVPMRVRVLCPARQRLAVNSISDSDDSYLPTHCAASYITALAWGSEAWRPPNHPLSTLLSLCDYSLLA